MGCVSENRYSEFLRTEKEINHGLEILKLFTMSKYKWRKALGIDGYANSSGNSRYLLRMRNFVFDFHAPLDV